MLEIEMLVELDAERSVSLSLAVATEDKQPLLVNLAQANVDHRRKGVTFVAFALIGQIQFYPVYFRVFRLLLSVKVRLVVEELDSVEELLIVEAAKNEHTSAAETNA